MSVKAQRGIIPSNLVTDIGTREVGEVLRKFVQGNPLLSFRGQLFRKVITQDENESKFPHGLGFVPRHIIVLRSPSSGTPDVYWATATTQHVVMDFSYFSNPQRTNEFEFFLGSFGD